MSQLDGTTYTLVCPACHQLLRIDSQHSCPQGAEDYVVTGLLFPFYDVEEPVIWEDRYERG